MIKIFHGDDTTNSRNAFIDELRSDNNTEVLRLNPKNIDLDTINNFLQGNSLFSKKKILAFDNYFSVHKTNLDKIAKLINNSVCDIYIWQDKNLTLTQIKMLPPAQIKQFKLDNWLYICLNSVKPGNIKNFLTLYPKVLQSDLYDLFLYLLKGNLRRQLTTFSRFDTELLKRCYLQLIELDFQNKNGELSIPKEIALERIMINLLK